VDGGSEGELEVLFQNYWCNKAQALLKE